MHPHPIHHPSHAPSCTLTPYTTPPSHAPPSSHAPSPHTPPLSCTIMHPHPIHHPSHSCTTLTCTILSCTIMHYPPNGIPCTTPPMHYLHPIHYSMHHPHPIHYTSHAQLWCTATQELNSLGCYDALHTMFPIKPYTVVLYDIVLFVLILPVPHTHQCPASTSPPCPLICSIASVIAVVVISTYWGMSDHILEKCSRREHLNAAWRSA
jgi:hypothetical protein